MEKYKTADITTRINSAKINNAERDGLLREKTGIAYRMIKRIHYEKFSYVRMTEIEKEQEGLLAIMDVIRDFDCDKSENFEGYLRWKIMGRLKAKARFQRQYDDRTAAYDSIVESGEDDKMMTGENRLVLMDYQKYEESGALAAEEYVCRKFMNSSVRAAVAGLPAREREFISWEYGLSGDGYHTLDETAGYFNLRKSKAKEIEARALSILRKELGV